MKTMKWKFTAVLTLALLLPPPLLRAQSHAVRPTPELELIVLGSGGPRSFGRASTSYLVLVEGVPRVLVDAGPGAFQAVGKLGLNLDRVDIVLLTHLHIDHSADLPAIFLDRSLTSDAPIHFRVFGPEGAGLFPSASQFVHLLLDHNGAYEYQKTFGQDEQIDTVDLPTALNSPAREIVSDAELKVIAIATHHGDCPSVAYRINYKGESVTFSGDMDSSALENLQTLAQDTDLLVFHAAVLDPPGSPEILYTLHTPPRQIGKAARAAHARQLLLSHIAPAIEEQQSAVMRSVAASYRGKVTFARDGMHISARSASAHARRRLRTEIGGRSQLQTQLDWQTD
ncbi:MAG TPA: MBL fold metallo-hydrolase [Candidatus Angelobacter sp.]|nr:MBL fold metallo-hydrolase [Candidatus Angelobacter sp.]